MATTAELESQLTKQQADYLKRLEQGGQLPTVVSEAWQKAGGEETKALRGQEAELLTKYGSAGAAAREKYKDVWSHTARGSLVAQDIESAYRPIANIRAELAMRAEALGIATQGAMGMYGAETEVAKTGLGFTQSAYERASAREAEQTRQRERAEELAIAAKKGSGAGGGVTKTEATADARGKLSQIAGAYKSMSWDELQAEARDEGFDPVFTRDFVYQKFLEMYPQLSSKVVKDMVYQDYFPDNWR